jgi:hypothetical protein
VAVGCLAGLDQSTKQRDVDRSMKRKSSMARLFGAQNVGRKDARAHAFRACVIFITTRRALPKNPLFA